MRRKEHTHRGNGKIRINEKDGDGFAQFFSCELFQLLYLEAAKQGDMEHPVDRGHATAPLDRRKGCSHLYYHR